jgi:hypothetical protein
MFTAVDLICEQIEDYYIKIAEQQEAGKTP